MKSVKRLFRISIIAFFCVSVCLAFMPYASLQKQNNVSLPVYIVGGVFWLSIFSGYGSFLILNHIRKKHLKASGIRTGRSYAPGFLRAWTNLPAKIFDILTVISLLALIITVVKFQSATQLAFGIMAVFFFSGNMHGLFNGVNYKYIKDNQKDS